MVIPVHVFCCACCMRIDVVRPNVDIKNLQTPCSVSNTFHISSQEKSMWNEKFKLRIGISSHMPMNTDPGWRVALDTTLNSTNNIRQWAEPFPDWTSKFWNAGSVSRQLRSTTHSITWHTIPKYFWRLLLLIFLETNLLCILAEIWISYFN